MLFLPIFHTPSPYTAIHFALSTKASYFAPQHSAVFRKRLFPPCKSYPVNDAKFSRHDRHDGNVVEIELSLSSFSSSSLLFFCENGIIIPGDESMIDHSNGIRVEWNRIESRVDWEKEYSNIFEFIGKLGSRVELFSTRDFVKACW